MRKARLNKPHAQVGPKRLARLMAEAQARMGLLDRIRNAQARARGIKRLDPHGLKCIHVPGMGEANIRTPYGAKIVRQRRAANRRARSSRKANR